MTDHVPDDDQFEHWLFDMDDALSAFVGSLDRETAVALDFAPPSLEPLERTLLDRYTDVEATRPSAEAAMLDGAARYVGETFRKNLGGKWFIDFRDPLNAFFGLPQLAGLHGQTTQICPLTLVTASLDRRTGKFLRTIYNSHANA